MGNTGADWTSLLWLLGALLLVAPALPRILRSGRALQVVAIWLAIAVAIALGYRLLVG